MTTAPAEEIKTIVTCGVCGRALTIDELKDPPRVRNVRIGTTPDGKPIIRPQLSKPLRMDPETGAVCWCPNDREQP